MLNFFNACTLQWRHNGRDSVSNHQPHDCLRNRLFKRRSTKTSKLRVTCLFVGNSPMTGEFPAQMASNAEDVSIWWRHHTAYSFSGTDQRITMTIYKRHGVLNRPQFNVVCNSLFRLTTKSHQSFTWLVFYAFNEQMVSSVDIVTSPFRHRGYYITKLHILTFYHN